MSVGRKSHRMFQPDGPALLVQQFPRWDSQGQQPQQQFNPPLYPLPGQPWANTLLASPFCSVLILPAGGHKEAICLPEGLGELSAQCVVSWLSSEDPLSSQMCPGQEGTSCPKTDVEIPA